MPADAGEPLQPFSIAFGPARLHSALAKMDESHIDSASDGLQTFSCGRAHVCLPQDWKVRHEPNNTLAITAPLQQWTLRVSPILIIDAVPEVVSTYASDIARDLGAKPVCVEGVSAFYATGERDGDTHHSYVIPRDSVVFIVTMSFPTGELDSGEVDEYLRSMFSLFFEADE